MVVLVLNFWKEITGLSTSGGGWWGEDVYGGWNACLLPSLFLFRRCLRHRIGGPEVLARSRLALGLFLAVSSGGSWFSAWHFLCLTTSATVKLALLVPPPPPHYVACVGPRGAR